MSNEMVIQPGGSKVPSVAVVREMIDAYLASLSPSTLRAYKGDLRYFAEFLKLGDAVDQPAAAAEALIAMGHGNANLKVLQYRNHMAEKGLKNSTICRRLSALRSMVTFSRMCGRIAWSIDIKGPEVEPYRDTKGPSHEAYMTAWRALRERADWAGDPAVRKQAIRDLAMMMVMHDLALRRGSLTTLQLSDVKLDDDPPTITYKAKRRPEPETRDLEGPIIGVLREWLAARGSADGPFFIRLDRDDLESVDGAIINRMVKRSFRRVGVTRRTNAHGLRHLSITRLLEKNNGNITEAMAHSGHRDSRVLMKYFDNMKGAAANALKTLAADYSTDADQNDERTT
jgi:integrase/recombinase XerC